jgi:hypothetical protein
VSPFAAGCAICGADLDTARWDSGPSVGNRIGSWFAALGAGPSRSGWTPYIILVAILFGGGFITSLLSGVW